jgi:hypothetical protein
MNTKLYFIKHFALVALFAMGLMLVPSVGTALAQKGERQVEVATQDMISYALNLKSLSSVAVYSENAVDGKGGSQLTNGFRTAGGNELNRKDLADVFSAANQLPCSEVADTDLSGKTFTPGVYCLASANLSSRLTLDAQGDRTASFVFRIAGGLNAKSGASIGLANDASANSVFFVSNDSAQIGDGVDFKGSVLARNSIGVGADSTVDGRVLSVKGEVALGGNAILGPQQTGVLEICKELDTTPIAGSTTPANGLENRIFQFNVPGVGNVGVPAGGCSGPLTVAANTNLLITELQAGTTFTGQTFNGNFQLVRVRTIGQTPPSTLVSANLPLFQATVNVREGAIASQSRVEFTNRFAIVAIVEICKEALDSGVTGFFNFNIEGLRSGVVNGPGSIGGVGSAAGGAGSGTLNNFTVPVGQCTGPIAVVTASDDDTVTTGTPGGNRRFGIVRVTELPRFVTGTTSPAFLCTNVFTAPGTVVPINRLVGFQVNANGGCFADVTVVAGQTVATPNSGSTVDPGGTAVQTTVFFNNRTAPSAIKICKIAGPGITVGSNFFFDVTGTAPLDPLAAAAPVPTGGGTLQTGGAGQAGGITGPGTAGAGGTGTVLQGGTVTTQVVEVIAGPAENGGFCNDAVGTFVVDTAATITERGATANFGEVRVSRITSSSGIIAAGPTQVPAATTGGVATTGVSNISNPGLFTSRAATNPTGISPLQVQPGVPFFPATGNTDAGRTVTVPVTREVAEVEYVNIAFSPVPLKVCKVAATPTGGGVSPLLNQPFTFTITADTVGGLLAPFTSTTTILAGPQAPAGSTQQNGFCDFVSGPFAGAQINGLNSFNFNSSVTIQETGFGSTVINAGGITSPTGGVVANVGTRTATITNLINGVNEVQFVNTPATNPTTTPKTRKRARFF